MFDRTKHDDGTRAPLSVSVRLRLATWLVEPGAFGNRHFQVSGRIHGEFVAASTGTTCRRQAYRFLRRLRSELAEASVLPNSLKVSTGRIRAARLRWKIAREQGATAADTAP